jgi:hypothetical protein
MVNSMVNEQDCSTYEQITDAQLTEEERELIEQWEDYRGRQDRYILDRRDVESTEGLHGSERGV